jgi:nucleotide-binding universal stress UspA family protein
VQVLVVDGANVVGSRPDGWWRHRPGAAQRLEQRLVQRLGAGTLGRAQVLLVLEGAARAGVPAGVRGQVRTVHAAGSGDDTIVELVRDQTGADVVVVTADRELRRRVEALGAAVAGPSWLFDRLADGA